MSDQDPLHVAVARADDRAPTPPLNASAVVAGAMRRVQRRRRHKRLIGGAVVVLTAGILATWAVHPRQAQGPTVAQLQLEVEQLKARAKDLEAQITASRVARETRGSLPERDGRLAREPFDEQRDRAAFVLVRSA